ncbi:MAG: VanZ family protein [Clostridia bacterium]|nr:VanZ family protein [Clostridia bacterium]
MTTKRKVFIIILSIAIVLTLAFIWTRSLSTGIKSAEESNNAYDTSVEVVRDVAGEHPAEVYKETITEHIFRKLAHFFEYSVLGLEVNLLFLCIFGYKPYNILWCSIFGFCSGGIDELIQYFIVGRNSRFLDVIIDFAGFSFYTIILTIIPIIIVLTKKKTDKSEKSE